MLCLQLDSSTSLVQHTVARAVAAHGNPHLRQLRRCSRSWRITCSQDIASVSCVATDLRTAVRFMNTLHSLKKITIRGHERVSCSIQGNELASVQASLDRLDLTSARKDDEGSWTDDMADGCAYPVTRVWNLSTLLLPHYSTLTCLRLKHCHFPFSTGNMLNSPEFFSRFPHLVKLELVSVHATPSLTILNLNGCTALQKLDCRGCQLAQLDVTSCSNLLSLNCSRNALTALNVTACTRLRSLLFATNGEILTLDLSCCPSLKLLDCHNNCLEEIMFSPAVELQTLFCRDTPYLLLEGVTVSTLNCDFDMFDEVWTPAMRAELQVLNLDDSNEPVSDALTGFEKLQSLVCPVVDYGSIDLTGCSSVDLVIHCFTTQLVITGRGTVHRLAIYEMWGLYDLIGFSTLQELHLSVSGLDVLDLSVCTTLCRFTLSMRVSDCSEDPSCSMSTINLTGCSSLELLNCTGFSTLTALDLHARPWPC